MRTQNILAAVLLFSAMVMTVLLVLPRGTAQADSAAVGSDYTLLATSAQAGGDETLVTIIDNQGQRMITYRLVNTKLEAIAGRDLNQLFGARP